MLSLYLLALHFLGDWLLQSNRMAARKLDEPLVRVEHCLVYTLTFLAFPVVAGWTPIQGAVFLSLLFASHFVIDSRRWYAPRPGFPTRAIWFDQVLHIVALAAIVAVIEGWSA